MKKVISLLLIVVGICTISITGSSCINRNSTEQVSDSIDSKDNNESEREIQEKIKFLKKFYKEKEGREQDDEYAYIKKNVTTNGLQNLKDLYDFDCEGECLAVWAFDYDEGSDTGDIVSFTIKPQDENNFLVVKKYQYAKYSVLLTVVKEDNVYKIDKIEQKESLYNPQEQNDYNEDSSTENVSNSYNEQREGETKQKTLQYMSDLQNIANEIDNVYNQYVSLVSSGDLDPMSHGNLEIKATQNISRLRSQAEKIWNNLIALARESGGDVRALQEEKQKFMSDAARIQMSIHSVGMNTGY